MHEGIERIKKTRAFLLKTIEDLSTEELNEIPAGFNNNILWNLAHMAASQQGICYVRSGEKPRLDEKYILAYKPQTKPAGFVDEAEVAIIKNLFITLLDDFEVDYNNKLFGNFVTYTTMYGVEIKNIEDAISFVHFHEGLHSGYIMALKRLVKNK